VWLVESKPAEDYDCWYNNAITSSHEDEPSQQEKKKHGDGIRVIRYNLVFLKNA